MENENDAKGMINGVIFICALIFGIWLAFSGTELKADDYGEAWPFTVDTVELACTVDAHPYVITPDGGYYGLTGAARQESYILDLDYIWQKPKSVGWVIELAFEEVCE